jgi:hypothetical protein
MRKAALPVLAAVTTTVTLLLAGCSAVPAAPAATASTPLRPGYPKSLTESVAKSETERYAAAIGGLVPTADVASVDNEEKLFAATSSSAPYYAVIRTITLNATADPLKVAAAIKKELVAAGWTSHASATESNQYLAALASSKSKSTAWFLELGANAITGEAPTVTVQLGSPDLPKS